jgi:hypothetical protein
MAEKKFGQEKATHIGGGGWRLSSNPDNFLVIRAISEDGIPKGVEKEKKKELEVAKNKDGLSYVLSFGSEKELLGDTSLKNRYFRVAEGESALLTPPVKFKSRCFLPGIYQILFSPYFNPRQGDQYLQYLEPHTIPPEATRKYDGVVAYGEASGHTHAVLEVMEASDEKISLYAKDDTLYLKVGADEEAEATLVHDTHRSIVIPSGEYLIRQMRPGYDPLGLLRLEGVD